jgi:hypothetical protein
MLLALCGVSIAQAPPEQPADLAASKITLDAADMPLADVVESFAKQSGNAPLGLPDDLRRQKVKIRLKDTPYWTALDALCDAAGLLYVPDLKSGGLRLDKALRREERGDSNGPVAVKLELVRRTGEFPRTPTGWHVDDLYYVLRFFYEDRLNVVEARAEVIEAMAPDGMRLIKTQINSPQPYAVAFAPPKRPPTGTLTLCFKSPPAGVDRVAALTGVVRLMLGKGDRRIQVADIATPEASASNDDFTMTVVSVEREAESARVAVRLGLKAQRTEAPLMAPALPYGFFLVGAGGERLPGSVERLERNFHAAAGADGEGDAAKVSGDVKYTLVFRGRMGAKMSLLFAYPERTEVREVPFRLTDLPATRGTPKPAEATR